MLLCLAVGVGLMLTDGGKSSPAAIVPAKPVGLYAAGVVDVGGPPQALLTDSDSLWIATPDRVVRLNLHNGSTIARLPIATNGVNAGLAFGAGSIWLAPTGSQLLRIDPSNNRVVASVRLGATDHGRVRVLGGGVAFAAGRVWVSRDSNQPRGDVISVNPRTDQAAATSITVGSGPGTVVSGFGSLWVENTSVVVGGNAPPQTYPAISRIDPRSRRVTTESFSGLAATGFGSLWVGQTNPGSDEAAILRVNPATGETLARIDVPRVVGVASGGGRVWAISYPRSRSASTFQPIKGTAALWQIDPQTNRVIGKPVHLSLIQPDSIVVSDGQLWIADYQSGKVIHFQLITH